MNQSFGSDNHAGIHLDILHAIHEANLDHCASYGDDPYTIQALNHLREIFGEEANPYLVLTGTAANVLAIKSSIESYQAVICASTAHINTDECGAPEYQTGSKLIPIDTSDGKLTPTHIAPKIQAVGDPHRVQARLISISQSTELGTIYTPKEILQLSQFAKNHNLLLHMDGARLANALASLKCSAKDLTSRVGVDILSFGGTKNGMLMGEAVIVLNPTLGKNLNFYRKQNMQLFSKMRFLSAQFNAYLQPDCWLENARKSNETAAYLATKLRTLPALKLTQKPEVNAIFVAMNRGIAQQLQQKYKFYIWNDSPNIQTLEDFVEVRLMCSFDTRIETVDQFLGDLEELLIKS